MQKKEGPNTANREIQKPQSEPPTKINEVKIYIDGKEVTDIVKVSIVIERKEFLKGGILKND